MNSGNIKILLIVIFCSLNFALVQQSIAQETEGQVYVCPWRREMGEPRIEDINPKCECRIDLILGETKRGSCLLGGKPYEYEMTLLIQEYKGQQYYAIYGFENGGAGVNLKPEARISGNFEGMVGESLNFSASESFDPNDDPLEFYWDFGDGSFTRGENVSHTYNFVGNYSLVLVAEDGLASSTATATVTIVSSPSPGGFVIAPFQIEKAKEEEKREEKEKTEKKEIEEETKFLAPPSSEISFKIPVEKETEEKEEIGKEKVSPKIEREIKKPIQKETFLASLIEVVKEKVSIFCAILISLFLLIFGILKVKNYFWRKRKL